MKTYVTFIDIVKAVLGQKFDIVCKQWKRVERNPADILYGNFEEPDFETVFNNIAYDIVTAIRTNKIRCYRKNTLFLHGYEETDSNAVRLAALEEISPYETFNTVDEFLGHFYHGIYFDAEEVKGAFPDLKMTIHHAEKKKLIAPDDMMEQAEMRYQELKETSLQNIIKKMKEEKLDNGTIAKTLWKHHMEKHKEKRWTKRGIGCLLHVGKCTDNNIDKFMRNLLKKA